MQLNCIFIQLLKCLQCSRRRRHNRNRQTTKARELDLMVGKCSVSSSNDVHITCTYGNFYCFCFLIHGRTKLWAFACLHCTALDEGGKKMLEEILVQWNFHELIKKLKSFPSACKLFIVVPQHHERILTHSARCISKVFPYSAISQHASKSGSIYKTITLHKNRCSAWRFQTLI